MRKNNFFKTLLVMAGLLVGSSTVLADDNTINATLEHTAGAKWGSGYDGTYESTVDAEYEFYNSSTGNWRGSAYAKFTYTIPDGHSILSATLTYNIEQSGNNKSGYAQNIYVMNEGFDLDWDTFAGQKNVDLSNSSYRGEIISNASTGSNGTVKGLTVDALSAVQALHSAGQDYIVFQWSDNGGAANLYGKGAKDASLQPTLVITTTNAQTYNVTFKEKNGIENVNIIGNGFIVNDGTATLANGSYTFTATATGYEDYQGNFTIDGADKEIEFAMTAKARVESVKVVYKLADGTEIASEEQENITGLYVGETATIPFRMYVTKDGKLYQTPNNSDNPYYGDNGVVLEQNVVVEKTVTEVNLGGGTLVFLKDLDDSDSNNSGVRASYESAYDNKAYTSEETLPAGVYTFIIRHYNRGRGSSIVVGETTVFTAEGNSWGTYTKNNIIVPDGGQLSLVAGSGRTIDLYDVIIAIKTSEIEVTANVTDAGWATLYTTVALDFSEVDGLTAYTATVEDDVVTLTKVENVPANTGVVLKGAGTHTIPVTASSETEPGDLTGSTTDTAYDAEEGFTYYVLTKAGKNEVQFNPATEGTIAAGKAYLKLADGAASKLRVVIAGEATAISGVNANKVAENGATYNVAGQLVNDSYKGIVIKNGKKYLNK